MLHSSEMTGWLALLFASIHYKELTTESALAAARGQVRFKLTLENVTVDKIKCIERSGIDNIDNLQKKLKLSKDTIVNIHMIVEVVKMAFPNDKKFQEYSDEFVLELINSGMTGYKIYKEYGVSNHRQHKLKFGYSIERRDRETPKMDRDTERELSGRTIMAAARKYWDTFSVGDEILAKIEHRGKSRVIKAKIVTVTRDYMTLIHKNRKIQIHFADILSKQTKIKKNLNDSKSIDKVLDVPRVNLPLKNNVTQNGREMAN